MALPVLPEFVEEQFSSDRLEALRDLTCYAVGLSTYKDVFPASIDEQFRPSDQDIHRFRTTSSKLNFAYDSQKIENIYTGVFKFLVKDYNRHRNLWHLFRIVYPQPEASRLPEAAAFFYDYFAVNQSQMETSIRSLDGVYSLYRMGETAKRDNEEFVKSILGIWGQTDGKIQWLEFKLAYKSGLSANRGARLYIKGVVVPGSLSINFLGVDEGMGRSPTLMICTQYSNELITKKFRGTLLRLNTLHIISAARTVLYPIKKTDPKISTRAWFDENEVHANIYPRTDPVFTSEFEKILDEIDNTVDGITTTTLQG